MRPIGQQLRVIDLNERIRIHAQLADLGNPYCESHRIGLLKLGLRGAFHYAEHCLGWIWHQWLGGTPHDLISQQVVPFVERGLKLRALSQDYEKLPQHDLLLLHCALFASPEEQLNEVVAAIGDVSGDKRGTPMDVGGLYAVAVGELYAAAWCGFLKYSILGDAAKATEHYNLIWKAKRDLNFYAAPKSLTSAWFKKDWKKFALHQQKDFDRLWDRARKHSWSVKSETDLEVVVNTRGYRGRDMWCWSHCGLAFLAYRQGVEVATDPLWLPPHALKMFKAHQPHIEPGTKFRLE